MTEPFLLADVHVCPIRGTLRRGDRLVTVQPRVMQVLLVLRTSDVVSRQALAAEVWKDTHVGYHAIPRAISQLRAALVRLDCTHIRVEALSKRGYSLRVDVAPTPAMPVSPSPSLPQDLRPLIGWGLLVVVVGLTMHALDAHGSPAHLLLSAGVLTGAARTCTRRSPVL